MTASTVTFARPFTLGRDARALPAGTYRTHVREEAHGGPLHTAWVTVAIDLIVAEAPGRTATRAVTPADLAAAQARDLMSA